MRIGILSDTHDQVLRTRAAVSLLIDRGAEALIHCGDVTGPDVVFECVGRPAYFVFGNCDDDQTALRRAMERVGAICLERGGLIALGGRRLAVTHGDSETEIRRLCEQGPDYLFTGHTHRQAEVQRGRTRWINPGALHRATTWTAVLLDLESENALVLPILNAKMHS
jgi:putative phosphoesterase